MLHIESQAPTTNPIADSDFFRNGSQTLPFSKGKSSSSSQLIEMTFRAVELDGQDLWREQTDGMIGQLAEASRLADLRDKTELKINNFAPWIEVGCHESCQVPILQQKIQRSLAAACKKLKRRVPASRLSLARGQYGIRCYLGRNKPTDHVYDEDFASDSR